MQQIRADFAAALNKQFPTIVEAFSALDGNMDGSVDVDELSQGTQMFNLEVNNPASELAKAFDEDGHLDRISYDEFEHNLHKRR